MCGLCRFLDWHAGIQMSSFASFRAWRVGIRISLSLSLSFIHFDLEYSFFVVRMLVCVPHIQIDCNTSATAVLASRKQDHRSFQALHRGSAYVFRLVAPQPRVVDDNGQRGTATELAHESCVLVGRVAELLLKVFFSKLTVLILPQFSDCAATTTSAACRSSL